jgi:hypothetical protein
MFDSRLRHSFVMLETFKKKFEKVLFDSIIHINVKLKESAVMGKPVAFFDKYSRGAKDYYTLAKEMILSERQEGQAENVGASEKVLQQIEAAEEKAATETVQKRALEKDALQREIDRAEAEEIQKRAAQPFSQRMQEVVHKEAQEFFTTCFAIAAPGAKSVYVTGSFNDWSLDDSCRLREVDGEWRVNIPLKAGFYKYQFIVDGVWKEDPNNPRRERNSFGDINSLVEVKPAQAYDTN